MDNFCCHVPFSTCLKLFYKTVFVDSLVQGVKLCWAIYYLAMAIRAQLVNKKDGKSSHTYTNLEILGYYGAAIPLLIIVFLRLICNAFLHRDSKQMYTKGDSGFSRDGIFTGNLCTSWKTWLLLMILSLALNAAIAGVEHGKGHVANVVIGVVFSVWEFWVFLLIILLRRTLQGYFNRRQLLSQSPDE